MAAKMKSPSVLAPNGQKPGVPSRREREKVQRREDLLRAAKKVFFKKGIHTATIDDVAHEAEVGKGTVYLYFDTKETILAHLLLEGLDMLVRVDPGVVSDATLLYAPEIKFYAREIRVDSKMHTNISGLYAAGDGAGLSRGIVTAAATGILAGRGMASDLLV